jgi:citrate lyase subunit beta/citryl-CoA lyase
MCMLETAAGILAAPQIAQAHSRVTTLIFGAADFCAEVGCSPITDRGPLFHAMSRLILAARTAGVAAIDAPYMTLGDSAGLERSVRLSKDLGFDGKSAIHPAQLPAIHACFSPTAEEIRWAESVVEALAATDSQQERPGATLLNGSLIEAPHLMRARRILESVRQPESEDR